jgi:hypothetical protein
MAEPVADPKALLREDLSNEYYACLDVISKYDGWLLGVKGWSVTLSLAGLGFGFEHRHFALFALAAGSAAAFWYLDGLMKGYQYRYYVRMREIEYTAYLINRVTLGGEYFLDLEISAPRIDMTWGFKGYPVDKDGNPVPLIQPWWQRVGRRVEKIERRYDWRSEEPERRSPQKIHRDLRHRFLWSNVALPHVVAVVAGLVLFILALVKAPGLQQLPL